MAPIISSSRPGKRSVERRKTLLARARSDGQVTAGTAYLAHLLVEDDLAEILIAIGNQRLPLNVGIAAVEHWNYERASAARGKLSSAATKRRCSAEDSVEALITVPSPW